MLGPSELAAHCASMARCVAQIPGMKARPDATRYKTTSNQEATQNVRERRWRLPGRVEGA